MNSITIILLLAALGIFVSLAARSKNIRTFQFQISIFIIIWILGDMITILQNNGIVHLVSMVFFSTMLWLRFYYSERSGRKIIEDLDPTLR
jgi:hypothetical protein